MSSRPFIQELVREAEAVLGHVVSVDIHDDPQHERIVVAGALGSIAPAARPRIHAMLLRYNHLWRDTGGLRMALDGQDQAALMLELPLCGMGALELAAVLRNFARIQGAWQQVLRCADGHEPMAGALAHEGLGVDPALLLHRA